MGYLVANSHVNETPPGFLYKYFDDALVLMTQREKKKSSCNILWPLLLVMVYT